MSHIVNNTIMMNMSKVKTLNNLCNLTLLLVLKKKQCLEECVRQLIVNIMKSQQRIDAGFIGLGELVGQLAR